MKRISKAVFDTGPFIHLDDINSIKLLRLFKLILTTKEILEESRELKETILSTKNIKIKKLSSKNKNFSKALCEIYEIHLGEATAISLCKQEKVKLFFTDDLDARKTAKNLGLKAHGTIAIILKSLKNNLINKKQAFSLVENLYHNSSLFLTEKLFKFVCASIDKFKQKNI